MVVIIMKHSFKHSIAEVKAVREADERIEREKEMDYWLRDIGTWSQSILMCAIWEKSNFDEKEKIYNQYKIQ